MKMICLLLVSSIFISELSAQESVYTKPDYSNIGKDIFDNTSEYFYPKIFNRYLEGDTTLNLDHFRHLYYGYTLQAQYMPYQESRYHEKMLVYLKKTTLTSVELNEFIKLAEMNLQDLPFDIRTLNILSFSYKQKNEILKSQIAKFKKECILKAIFSTGNGLTEQTAYCIIDQAHEYDIINESGLKFGGTSELSNSFFDYVLTQQNEKNIRGYYFDVSRILKVKAERN